MQIDSDIIPIAFLIMVAAITKFVSDGRTRRQLIAAGVTAEVARAVNASATDRQSSLKWGLVIVAVGVALILNDLLAYDSEDPIFFGIVLVAGGLGLLAFYRLAAAQKGGLLTSE